MPNLFHYFLCIHGMMSILICHFICMLFINITHITLYYLVLVLLVHMALQIKYSLHQLYGDCNCFYFQDTTGIYSSDNKCGYGLPNIEKEAITKTEIFITDNKGNKYKIDRHYLPSRGAIKICTSDFKPLVELEAVEPMSPNDCGCPKPTPPPSPCLKPKEVNSCESKTPAISMVDGCYTLEYLVWANVSTKKVCDFVIKDISLQQGQSLWVDINGVLVNATMQIVDGTLSYLQTNDIIGNYYIKNGDVYEFCGVFASENCNYVALAVQEEAIVSRSINREVFLCNTETLLSNTIYKTNIDTCYFEKDNNSNYLLALCIAKLSGLKNDAGCNCTCIDNTIVQINNILNNLNARC